MSFDDLIDAVRAADGEDAELAVATQARLRRSLEVRARGRHQLVGLLTALAILSGGTVSWALATGRVAALWAPAPLPRTSEPAAPEAPAPAPARRVQTPRAHEQAIVEPVIPAPIDIPPPVEPVSPVAIVSGETAPAIEIAPVEPVSPRTAAPAVAPVEPPAAASAGPVEEIYRKAHELHFRGGDPAAALAAWNAYLTAEPAGRFSVEARYNRAIVLIRLRRYAEARAELAPFARGEVEPAGYRQSEAEQLVERLGQYR